MKKTVSVIIPTYNNLDLLKKNLPAVFKMMRAGDELMVADDASSDQTVKFLKKEFNLEKAKETQDYTLYTEKKNKFKIKLVVNKKNKRFALNVNQAVDLAEGELVFLLNSDVKPEADALDVLCRHFEKDKEGKLFAVSCLEYEGKDKNAPKAGKNKLWYEFGLFTHSKATDFKAGPTAWASGGSALFDKKKWLVLSGFDPKFYPAYWEDVDLSVRACKKDWQVLFEPKAVVYHEHETTNKNVFNKKQTLKLSWQHADYFTLKHGDFWQKLAYFIWRPYWWTKRKLIIKNEK